MRPDHVHENAFNGKGAISGIAFQKFKFANRLRLFCAPAFSARATYCHETHGVAERGFVGDFRQVAPST